MDVILAGLAVGCGGGGRMVAEDVIVVRGCFMLGIVLVGAKSPFGDTINGDGPTVGL